MSFRAIYRKDINGKDSHSALEREYLKIVKELSHIGIPVGDRDFREFHSLCENERANYRVILAHELPLVSANLQATKYRGSNDNPPSGELSICVYHFEEKRYSRIEKIAEDHGLRLFHSDYENL